MGELASQLPELQGQGLPPITSEDVSAFDRAFAAAQLRVDLGVQRRLGLQSLGETGADADLFNGSDQARALQLLSQAQGDFDTLEQAHEDDPSLVGKVFTPLRGLSEQLLARPSNFFKDVSDEIIGRVTRRRGAELGRVSALEGVQLIGLQAARFPLEAAEFILGAPEFLIQKGSRVISAAATDVTTTAETAGAISPETGETIRGGISQATEAALSGEPGTPVGLPGTIGSQVVGEGVQLGKEILHPFSPLVDVGFNQEGILKTLQNINDEPASLLAISGLARGAVGLGAKGVRGVARVREIASDRRTVRETRKQLQQESPDAVRGIDALSTQAERDAVFLEVARERRLDESGVPEIDEAMRAQIREASPDQLERFIERIKTDDQQVVDKLMDSKELNLSAAEQGDLLEVASRNSELIIEASRRIQEQTGMPPGSILETIPEQIARESVQARHAERGKPAEGGFLEDIRPTKGGLLPSGLGELQSLKGAIRRSTGDIVDASIAALESARRVAPTFKTFSQDVLKFVRDNFQELEADLARLRGEGRASIFDKVSKKFSQDRINQLLEYEQGTAHQILLGDKRAERVLRRMWSASAPRRKKFAQLRKANAEYMRAKVRSVKTKRRIEQLTGLADVRKAKTPTTPAQLLNFRLTAEAKGSKQGVKAGRLAQNAEVREVIEFATERLSKSDLGKILPAIKAIKTPAGKRKAIVAVNRIINNINKTNSINALRETIGRGQRNDLFLARDVGGRREFTPVSKAIADVLKDFGEKGVTMETPLKKTVKKLRSAAEKAQQETGKDLHDIKSIDPNTQVPFRMVENALEAIEKSERDRVRDLAPEEITLIDDSIKMLIAQAEAKRRINTGRKVMDAQIAQEKSAEGITKTFVAERKGAVVTERSRNRGPAENVFRKIGRALTFGQLSLDTKTHYLDNLGGIARQVLFEQLRKARGDQIGLVHKANDAMVEGLKGKGIDPESIRPWIDSLSKGSAKRVNVELPGAVELVKDRAGNNIPASRPGLTVKMTIDELINLHNMFKDARTRQQFLSDRSGGFVFGTETRTGRNAIRITFEDIKAINDAAEKNPSAWGDVMFDYMNENRNGLNDVSRREQGIEIAKENYWPSERAGEFTQKDLADPNRTQARWFENLLATQGLFKGRVTHSDAPFVVKGASQVFAEYVTRTSSYIAKSEAIANARNLMSPGGKFSQAVKRRVPDGANLLRDMEKTILDFEGLQRRDLDTLDQLSSKFGRNLTVGILGGKPRIVAQQVLSVANASVFIPGIAKHFIDTAFGLALTKKSLETRAQMRKWSPDMRARLDGDGRIAISPDTTGVTIEQMFGLKPKGFNAVIEKLGMGPIRWADSLVMEAIWRTALEEGRKLGLEGDALMKRTAERTVEVMDLTQPTGDSLTVNSLILSFRKQPIKRFFIMFMSQRQKNVNMVARAMFDFMRSKKTAADYRQLASGVLIPTLVNSTMLELFRAAGRAVPITNDRQKRPREILTMEDLVLSTLDSFGLMTGPGAANVPLVLRELMTRQSGTSRTQTFAERDPAFSTLQGLNRGIAAMILIANKEGVKPATLSDPKFQRALERALGEAFKASGIPFDGANNIKRNVIGTLNKFREQRRNAPAPLPRIRTERLPRL